MYNIREMNTQTSLTNTQGLEDLYNVLMWEIEPELTTQILPDLEFIYRKESSEDRQTRYEWYAIAFAQFADSYLNFIGKCKHHMQKVNKSITKLSEQSATEKESFDISTIEQSIDDA